ncbi:glycosyltransferase, partial [Candidatus Woesearchaeota archaeon]|nr:glycosyltransferase [Candidatus Woesearchaeota archaeon]
MKILYSNRTLYPFEGGADISALTLLEELAKKHKVSAVYIGEELKDSKIKCFPQKIKQKKGVWINSYFLNKKWEKILTKIIKEEIINGVNVHRHFHILKVANFASVFPSLLWSLSKYKFNIIHTHVSGHAHTFFASLIAKLKKTPLIHTTHCPWTTGFRSLAGRILVWLSYNTFNRINFKFSDKIIAITPWE